MPCKQVSTKERTTEQVVEQCGRSALPNAMSSELSDPRDDVHDGCVTQTVGPGSERLCCEERDYGLRNEENLQDRVQYTCCMMAYEDHARQ